MNDKAKETIDQCREQDDELIVEVRMGDEWPTYLVRFDNDVYEMSERANMPNGVNMFYGWLGEWLTENHFQSGKEITDLASLPEGMKIAIKRECVIRIQQYEKAIEKMGG